jgi:hypothetical protein
MDHRLRFFTAVELSFDHQMEDLADDAKPVADRVDQRVGEGWDGKVSTLAPINCERDTDQ